MLLCSGSDSAICLYLLLMSLSFFTSELQTNQKGIVPRNRFSVDIVLQCCLQGKYYILYHWKAGNLFHDSHITLLDEALAFRGCNMQQILFTISLLKSIWWLSPFLMPKKNLCLKKFRLL